VTFDVEGSDFPSATGEKETLNRVCIGWLEILSREIFKGRRPYDMGNVKSIASPPCLCGM